VLNAGGGAVPPPPPPDDRRLISVGHRSQGNGFTAPTMTTPTHSAAPAVMPYPRPPGRDLVFTPPFPPDSPASIPQGRSPPNPPPSAVSRPRSYILRDDARNGSRGFPAAPAWSSHPQGPLAVAL